ncbi:phosphatase PAP2 family protein [Rathayibacter toxicus]|uniref:PAP2 family protein n=1 Tax=Rathayibacter toxicus TaxID=145458 RepID=A0A2S5Y5W2_9MICO|nr:phosphatase PAP2 family protein [Rathayibacter toxicus]PPG20331.1 PAP2 family protein [Rathayibacter toxicus]PPG45432.1 PAP2 family protein [Rathayibacter toxicus]PPH22534.1 PAP2 family protein [Rathayibacter toxicus]PPH57177.1 PAP2 family protein [Rathayibacter toxicus]PPH59428.1 PAP2 family protein [Rathayibacter toxicus]
MKNRPVNMGWSWLGETGRPWKIPFDFFGNAQKSCGQYLNITTATIFLGGVVSLILYITDEEHARVCEWSASAVKNGALYVIAHSVTTIGNPVQSTVCTAAVIIIASGVYGFRFALGGAVISFASAQSGALAKLIIARERPRCTGVTVAPDFSGYSFPSGHALSATVFCGFVAILGSQIFVQRLKTVILSFSFILWLGISWSRVILAAHYPSDVIGAQIIGQLFVFFAVFMFDISIRFYTRIPRGSTL